MQSRAYVQIILPALLIGALAFFARVADADEADDEAAIAAAKASGGATGGSSADDLSRDATDPTASLMSFGFITDYTGGFHGDRPGFPDDSDDAWVLNFRPVIPFKAFGQKNILRLTMPYQVSGPGDEGLLDVALFDLLIFDQTWGRIGVGPILSFATADFARDDVTAGPALGFVWQASKRLNVGLFNQNLFGDDTALSQLQPIIAYQLGSGWSVSAGDVQYVYDFEDTRWLSIPIGGQVGKVTKLFAQPIRFSLNPQYNLADHDGLPEWSIKLGVTLLAPAK